jgi:mono/diheme cytochrome c family protein
MKSVTGLLVVSLVTVALAQALVTVTLTTRPSPPGLGQNTFEATVKDARGQPVADADVALLLLMPADPQTKHPEMRTEGKLNNVGGGKYTGIALVTMAGNWEVTVTARRNGKEIGRRTEWMMVPLKRTVAKLKNPVPASGESISSGAGIFAKQCASCHGSGGKGDGAMAAKLKSKPSDLTDSAWTHGPTDAEIFTLIRDGAKNTGMKAFRGTLTDRQMWDLVNFIRSIGPGHRGAAR